MAYTEQELKQQHIDYIKALFENGDWVAINDTIFKSTAACSIQTAAKTMSIYMAINPIKEGTKRGQDNVTRNSAWLLEADKQYDDFDTASKDENGKEIEVPIEVQRKAIIDSGIPFATIVYSGGKSLHIVPRVNQHLSVDTWKAIWHAFSHVMWKYGLRVDPQTCDRARWTRRPGVMRDNGNLQTLEMLGKRVDLDVLEAWFAKHDIDWKDYIEESKHDIFIDWQSDSIPEAAEAHKAVKRYMLKGRDFGSESRAMDAFHYFKCMRGTGISQSESLALALQEWGQIPSRDYESTTNIITTECNNVWKKTSVPAFAITSIQKHDIRKEPIETTPNIELDLDTVIDEVAAAPVKLKRPRKEVFFRDINNYILMGNDIMRLDYAYPDRLNTTKINSTTFKKKLLFTDQHFIGLEEYDGFINEPCILDYQRRIHGSKWNTFSPVSHEITPGAWPTIEKLIKHLFDENEIDHDQVEDVYDRHTVIIKHPKWKQQAIILFSKAQKTAKSTFALLENLLVGDNNYVRIKNDELESTFNSVWINSLIMNIDEPYFNDKKKMTKIIRDMVTAPKLNLRKMQQEHEKVDFFGKLVVTTNDTDFMTFEKADRRYWARKAFVFPETEKDTLFETKMRKEVGHYIYFLLNERRMKYPVAADETFWLPQSVTQTGSFKLICEDNESVLHIALKEIFTTLFLENKEVNTIAFRGKDVLASLEEIKNDFAGLKLNQLNEAELRSTIREVIGADNNGGKGSKLKIGEMDMGTKLIARSGGKDPVRYWRVSRSQFNLDDALFNL